MEVARREIAAVAPGRRASEADGTQALTDLATLTRIIDGLRNGANGGRARPTGC